jgi:hypothetical protein
MARQPRWDVLVKLDGHPERQSVRALTAYHAAWSVALDLADRGFAERVELVSVELHLEEWRDYATFMPRA